MVTVVTTGAAMVNRKTVFEIADSLWAAGRRPSVRNVRERIGGSFRDISPLVALWWHERSKPKAQPVDGSDERVADAEARMEEQRRFYMMQIDAARTEARDLRARLALAEKRIANYGKLLKEEVFSAENDSLKRE